MPTKTKTATKPAKKSAPEVFLKKEETTLVAEPQTWTPPTVATPIPPSEVKVSVEETPSEIPAEMPSVVVTTSEVTSPPQPVLPPSVPELPPVMPPEQTEQANPPVQSTLPSITQPEPSAMNISTGVNTNVSSSESISESDGSGMKKKLIVGCLLLVVLVLLGVGIYLFRKDSLNKMAAKSAETATKAQETPVVEETAKKEVDLTKYGVKVLNGSGISGEAAKVKTLLEGIGFKVIGTGNAKESTFTETEISAKKEVDSEYLKILNETLAKSYSISTESAELSASGSADVVVTIGSSKT